MSFVDDGISSPPGASVDKTSAGIPVSGPNPVSSAPASGVHVIVDSGSTGGGSALSIANSVWFDPASPTVFYVRRELNNAGTYTVTWENLDGTAAAPTVANLRPYSPATQNVVAQAGEAHIGEVGGSSAIVGATFTRPADTNAYATGDLIANNVTAGSVQPMVLAASRIVDKTGVIRRGRLTKSGSLTSNAIFRAHFYKDIPVPANGDNGVFQTAGALVYIGSMDFDMTGANARAFSDGVKCIGVPNVGSEIIFDPKTGTQNIYALLEARGAYVPVSGEIFTLALEVFRD